MPLPRAHRYSAILNHQGTPEATASVRCSEDNFKCQLDRARAADLIERVEACVVGAGQTAG